jgi:hypothetical protein
MTLTRLIPSLRSTIPDPINLEFWPELTEVTTTDITVSGLSLDHLAAVCGTPCTHSGASVVPGTRGRPSETHRTDVLVMRVIAVDVAPTGQPVILTDAILGERALVWSELRLINRASTRRAGMVLVALTSGSIIADLPLDVRAGDLLAIPSVPVPFAASVPESWLASLD